MPVAGGLLGSLAWPCALLIAMFAASRHVCTRPQCLAGRRRRPNKPTWAAGAHAAPWRSPALSSVLMPKPHHLFGASLCMR